ncbi:AIPR family protein [Porticoccaceae bacterium]|nr:AIPR family protein [Porticoccaceae bacterium]
MQSELSEFKADLHQDVEIESTFENQFPEESFFTVVTEKLSEAGILDNVEYCPYKNTQKGIRIDGYCWNELERTLCGIVTHLSSGPEELDVLTNTELKKISKRCQNFFEDSSQSRIQANMDPSSPGYMATEFLQGIGDQILKYRIVLITDFLLSSRIKNIKIDSINNINTSIEIWDLERLHALAISSSQSEPFSVDEELFNGGLPVFPTESASEKVKSYMGVMPARVLSNIYDTYGQRLLESNVRTFLDFRSGVNKGLRRSLLLEPENFFAYNNGITVTADSAEFKKEGEMVLIKSLKNMQIVNGGQTTAAIYFSPREKGAIKSEKGDIPFSSIDLNRIAVQMKLTVFDTDDQDFIDEYKSSISQYANSQNSVQQSDLVSNHPFHMAVERLSRQILMPAGENGIAQKWFYERTRGQYSTKLRALGSQGRKRYELEYPKSKLFTKTDLAKYENTFRMRPHIVKKGAQNNLKALGAEIIREYEASPEQFEAGFYRDLIAKAIIFKTTDSSVRTSYWYKEEGGLKAEAVTFSIALMRSKLIERKEDINLDKIFKEQSLSISMIDTLVEIGRIVRKNISDSNFRGGTGNPSEFCKSENGWKRIQAIEIDLSTLDSTDIIGKRDLEDRKKEVDDLNKTSKSLTDYEQILNKGESYWKALATNNLKTSSLSDIRVSIPMKCAQMIGGRAMLSDKQMKAAIRISNESEASGFEFSGS